MHAIQTVTKAVLISAPCSVKTSLFLVCYRKDSKRFCSILTARTVMNILRIIITAIYFSATAPSELEHPRSRGYCITHTHTHRRTTVCWNPLDECSARRRDLYLTTHNTQQTAIHAPGEILNHNLSRRTALVRAVTVAVIIALTVTQYTSHKTM
jgi:hypothetical protein